MSLWSIPVILEIICWIIMFMLWFIHKKSAILFRVVMFLLIAGFIVVIIGRYVYFIQNSRGFWDFVFCCVSLIILGIYVLVIYKMITLNIVSFSTSIFGILCAVLYVLVTAISGIVLFIEDNVDNDDDRGTNINDELLETSEIQRQSIFSIYNKTYKITVRYANNFLSNVSQLASKNYHPWLYTYNLPDKLVLRIRDSPPTTWNKIKPILEKEFCTRYPDIDQITKQKIWIFDSIFLTDTHVHRPVEKVSEEAFSAGAANKNQFTIWLYLDLYDWHVTFKLLSRRFTTDMSENETKQLIDSAKNVYSLILPKNTVAAVSDAISHLQNEEFKTMEDKVRFREIEFYRPSVKSGLSIKRERPGKSTNAIIHVRHPESDAARLYRKFPYTINHEKQWMETYLYIFDPSTVLGGHPTLNELYDSTYKPGEKVFATLVPGIVRNQKFYSAIIIDGDISTGMYTVKFSESSEKKGQIQQIHKTNLRPQKSYWSLAKWESNAPVNKDFHDLAKPKTINLESLKYLLKEWNQPKDSNESEENIMTDDKIEQFSKEIIRYMSPPKPKLEITCFKCSKKYKKSDVEEKYDSVYDDTHVPMILKSCVEHLVDMGAVKWDENREYWNRSLYCDECKVLIQTGELAFGCINQQHHLCMICAELRLKDHQKIIEILNSEEIRTKTGLPSHIHQIIADHVDGQIKLIKLEKSKPPSSDEEE